MTATAHRPGRLLLAAVLGALLLLLLAARADAQAGPPQWTIALLSEPTHLAPGDHGDRLIVTAVDTGAGIADGASEPITITDTLPGAALSLGGGGVLGAKGGLPSGAPMTCTTSPVISCTTSEPVIPGDVLKMTIDVDVAADAPAALSDLVRVEGGGGVPAAAELPLTVSPIPAGPGLAPGSPLSARSGAAAGAHPDFTAAFSLATSAVGVAAGAPKGVSLALPPGLVVDAAGLPRCPLVDLGTETCPRGTVVGRAFATVAGTPAEPGTTDVAAPIVNVEPAPGEVAALAFAVPDHAPVRLDLAFAPGGGYHLRASTAAAEEARPLLSTVLTLWGVPADLNGPGPSGGFGGPGEGPRRALVTNPTSCGADQPAMTLALESWTQPGFAPVGTGTLGPTVECALPAFAPTVVAQPDTTSADSPAGLRAEIQLPQNPDPDGLGTADLERSVFVLPRGLVPNPAAAEGLAGCAPAEIGLASAPGSPLEFSPAAAACPASSRIGSMAVTTPLLGHPLGGSVYLAKPFENPFGSLLAIYATVEDPATGTVVKLAGKVEPDPSTHRLIATFAGLPQLPFEVARLELDGGPRAALRTPPTCGAFATETDLTPWSSPAHPDAAPGDSFPIASGAGGSPCQSSEGALPNQPSFQTSTANIQAGAYTPFDFRLGRADGSQELAKVDLTLPKGLLGKLAGVADCTDAQIAAAAVPPTDGSDIPASCPSASQIGTATATAGAGPEPLKVTGKVFLAGPYKGAPYSLAVVVPAIAGPFDLGNVVSRAALHPDPESTQVTVTADPFPTELEGIPLDIRSIDVDVDRPEFMINPTNCEPKQVLGTATSVPGQSVSLQSPFALANCEALGFRPKISLKLKGGTHRGAHPALSVRLTAPQGPYANFSGGVVVLPHSEFIDQGHIRTVCTRVQFAAAACPPGSIYGHASAVTPLLAEPLSGPVYMRSSNHVLPDVVADLHSGPIEIVLVTKIDSVHGGLRSTVEGTPDAPLASYTLHMQGGKKGLLVNSQNLCGAVHRIYASFTAQNGKKSRSKPVLGDSCPKRSKKKKHHRRHRHHPRHRLHKATTAGHHRHHAHGGGQGR
jgi:hypothetical protein